jgi:hypothetical protein
MNPAKALNMGWPDLFRRHARSESFSSVKQHGSNLVTDISRGCAAQVDELPVPPAAVLL